MVLCVAVALVVSCALEAIAAPAPKRVLFFTKSSGFQHSVIKLDDRNDCHACGIMRELGAKHGFVVHHTKDGGMFTPQGLAKYDAYVFYTSGDLTKPGTDAQPPMSADGKALLLDSVRKGKGFVSMHAATDTFHTGTNRYRNDGDAADPYIKMLGGEFIRDDRALRLPDIQDMSVQLRANLKPLTGIELETFADVINVLALRTTTSVVVNDGPTWGATSTRLNPMRLRLGFRFRY